MYIQKQQLRVTAQELNVHFKKSKARLYLGRVHRALGGSDGDPGASTQSSAGVKRFSAMVHNA